MDKPSNDALFDLMETAGFMNAAQRAALEALADKPVSLSDVNKLGRVTAGHVQAARIAL